MGNLICSICNPVEVKFFKINTNELNIDLEMSTANCPSFINLKVFESKVLKFLNYYVKPVYKVAECIANINKKEENERVLPKMEEEWIKKT